MILTAECPFVTSNCQLSARLTRHISIRKWCTVLGAQAALGAPVQRNRELGPTWAPYRAFLLNANMNNRSVSINNMAVSIGKYATYFI